MKTKITCRFVWFEGELIAVFMGSSAGRRYSQNATASGGMWLRNSYQHTGQHGECYDGMQRRKRATPAEYRALKKELEAIGYTVKVI